MDVKTALTTRRSVHNFDPKKQIDEKALHDIFDLVRYTPSGYNLQPVEFLLVTDKKLQEKLKEVSYNQQHVADASAVAIILARKDPQNWSKEIFADWKKKGYFNDDQVNSTVASIQNWPTWFGEVGMKTWAHKHAGLYGMALMVAAMQYGVQTEPMEGFESPKVRELFKIPDQYEIPMFVCLGYQNKELPPQLDRKPVNKLIHFNSMK